MASKTNPVTAEQFSAFTTSRHSTRAFLPTPVDPAILDQLLTDAMTSPSWSNTRPYMVAIATGDRRDRISKELVRRSDALTAGRRGNLLAKAKLFLTWFALPHSDYRIVRPYPKQLNERSKRIGKGLYDALGIARDDVAGRDAQWRHNFEFFGAPVELFIFTHTGLDEYSVSDAGIFMQTLMLSAHAHGLGTCAQGSAAIWSEPVKREFQIPAEYNLLCGIAVGYPAQAAINDFRAERIDISEIIAKPV